MKKLNHNSGRLNFRNISLDETTNIHNLHSFPEVDEFNTLGIPKDIEETKEFITPFIEDQNQSPRKKYCWAVYQKSNGKFTGLAAITISADRFNNGEIYYKILPNEWRKGFGTDITKWLISFGFNLLKLHRIEAGVAVDNIRSIKVLEKAGMKKEGVGRKILPIRGEWRDNFRYSIIEDDERTY